MRVLIIEDEKPAAQKLLKAIQQYDAGVEIIGTIGSIAESVEWFKKNPEPSLVFMDIELSDGLSFSILDQMELGCPVIFTTAYDDHWQEAFEYNSIDYLLKPIKQEKLELALKKYHSLKRFFSADIKQLKEWNGNDNAYKKRFLVKRGADYISLKTEEIAYFYATHKLVCLVDKDNRKFILDQSLSDIEKQLDPSSFYRINRKYLVNMSAIKRMKVYPKSKLQLELEPVINDEIIIAQENVAAFKEWMGQ